MNPKQLLKLVTGFYVHIQTASKLLQLRYQISDISNVIGTRDC